MEPRKNVTEEGLRNNVRQKIQLFLYFSLILSPCRSSLVRCQSTFICKYSVLRRSLNHLPGLKEDTEVTHLPCAGDSQNNQLDNGPGHSVAVSGLTLVTELSLVVLTNPQRNKHKQR